MTPAKKRGIIKLKCRIFQTAKDTSKGVFFFISTPDK
nr:MAG TPA: hypothetical protein [Caudoviricetes sp.]